MSIEAMLKTHPRPLIAELGVLARCIDECGECAATCTVSGAAGAPRVDSPRTTSAPFASGLLTRAKTIVPSGTRMIGPGMLARAPRSANARTTIPGASSPSGRQSTSRTSRCTLSTPSRNVPAARRLSFATARSAGGVRSSAVRGANTDTIAAMITIA